MKVVLGRKTKSVEIVVGMILPGMAKEDKVVYVKDNFFVVDFQEDPTHPWFTIYRTYEDAAPLEEIDVNKLETAKSIIDLLIADEAV
ncbi:hypothetical protein HYS94_02165 [Candidatus Daviesbacteria bacterium]|nr:hypothetical protein [Candidatus Daviesbacteria bacterium]